MHDRFDRNIREGFMRIMETIGMIVDCNRSQSSKLESVATLQSKDIDMNMINYGLYNSYSNKMLERKSALDDG
jgi:hypothetical protein